MSEFFLKVVNMSISASWLVLAVLLLRLVLKKAPKWVSVLLWGFVAIRLICPFSIESMLSLIPSAETISPEIMMDPTPEIHTGIHSLNSVINPVVSNAFAPDPLVSMNPLQLWIPLAAVAWIAGIAAMLIYTAVSYILLRRKVATAVLLRDNIFQSENVDSPFVLGIVGPKIYLPFRMDGKNLEHVIAHEKSHIRRRDHWWKPLGFVLLALHWFNPLMWLGYILLCRDIELACDEKVIKEMDNESKADYTQALVACSVDRRSIAACPLAFGEVGVKARVKSVMNYKKPAFWIIAAAIITCVAVAVCFLTNPLASPALEMNGNNTIAPPVIATDYISGNQASLLSFGYTSDKPGQSVIACGIAPWQGDYGDNNTLVLDGRNGQNQILLAPKGFSFSQYRIYLPDGTVYDDGTRAGYSSLSLRVMQSQKGICLIAPSQTGEYIYEVELSWPEQGLTVIYGLKIVMTGKESDYDRAIDSVFAAYGEGNPLIAVSLVDKYAIGNAVSRSPRYLFKIENIPNAPIWVEVSQSSGEIIAEVDAPEQWPVDPPYFEGQAQIYGNTDGCQMTLADVITLSQKGHDLRWSDFGQFKYYETGSGLYIRVYEINEEFEVWIGGSFNPAQDDIPMYIHLTLANDRGQKIDIRDGGVTEFISKHSTDS